MALVLVALSVGAFFAAGSAVAGAQCARLAHEGVLQRFMEFLQVASDLDIVAVDRDKLDEVVIIASEANW